MRDDQNNMEAADPIPISALEHYAYCPRQCALIHVEQVWDENLYTMRGRDVHERVHDDSSHELAGRAGSTLCRSGVVA